MGCSNPCMKFPLHYEHTFVLANSPHFYLDKIYKKVDETGWQDCGERY